MTSLLDKVRNKLGLKKDKFAMSTGQTLGGGKRSPHNDTVFDVTFTEASLGFTVHAAPTDHILYGSPIVVEVTPGTAADAYGVKVGDVILSIESNAGQISYGDFVDIVVAIGRPLTLRFQRFTNGDPLRPAGAVSRRNQQSGRSVPAPLTEEERTGQRAAMREAALNREKAWDRRVSSAASARRRKAPEGPSAAGAVETDGPVQLGRQLSEEEMKAAAARAKESEQRTVESLGYNPFQPHFSSNSSEVRHQVNSATAGSSISAASSSAKLRPSQREEGGDREGELALVESQVGPEAVAQLNEALFELAYGEADASSRMTCVDTAMKMLANIQRNPNEIKFSKVAEVEGGLEVMMAAGFELSQGADGGEEDNETYLRHGPTALTAKGKGEFEGGREAEVQQYLSLCELKLTYTLRRLEILKVELSGAF